MEHPNALIAACVDPFLKRSPRPMLHGRFVDGGQNIDFQRGKVKLTAPPVYDIGSIGKIFYDRSNPHTAPRRDRRHGGQARQVPTSL